jgi:dihydroorotate dehydrogenase (fumarate)/dihydroorotate dehydrogenase
MWKRPHAKNTAGRLYGHVLRPLLFRISADRSHALAHLALSTELPWKVLDLIEGLSRSDSRLRCSFAGVALANPVGLAAGFDKDVELVPALSHLGFGFVTVGSIMPETRRGNPFPRLVRYSETESLADSMGVPSKGLPYALDRLARLPQPRHVPIFANVGGFTAASIANSFDKISPFVDGVEVSLMCPNVPQARENFDELKLLRELLPLLHKRIRPLIVRIPNDTAVKLGRLADFVEICADHRVEGLKIGGGSPIDEPRLGAGQGTLHGRAIFSQALTNARNTIGFVRGRMDVKGNGGIATGEELKVMLDAGCSCVDIYSAFIYQGWRVAQTLNRRLLASS